MYRFDAAVHVRPDGIKAGEVVEIGGRPTPTLDVAPNCLSVPMQTSFEQASEQLAALPGLFIEPDGSFVWTASGGSWRVEGYLYDRADRLLLVELRGSCPEQSFDAVLRACGWPATDLIFQLRQHAVFLDESTFRGFASAS